MSHKKSVIKSKIHSANKVLSVADKSALETKTADLKRREIEMRQEAIDKYNFEVCNIIDPVFNNIQLTGKQLIVRLHKENYIKNVEMSMDGTNVIYDAWISQVDGRMNRAERENWVDNPLPYVFQGTVVSISPMYQLELDKEYENLKEEYGTDLKGYKKLEVGDVVTLNHFMFSDSRYYVDKQARDFIKNPAEYRIEHWEGYVKIHPTQIESIVKEKALLEQASPYMMYKKYIADNNLNVEQNGETSED